MEAIAAARTAVNLWYDDTDISADAAPMLVSFEYTDYASAQVDDIQVTLRDPDDRWCHSWYPEKGARLRAEIVRTEGSATSRLPCGTFVIDTPSYSSPGIMTLKATSASVTTSLRRETRSREWKNVTLKQLAAKIATERGVTIFFQDADTPPLSKLQQKDKSDLDFLLTVCQREGYALKVESNRLVIYSRAASDARPAVATLYRRAGIVESWTFAEDQVDSYRACEVKYKHPDKKLLTATYTPPDASDEGQVLKIREHVGSHAEAIRLARAKLEQANRERISCDMGLIGDTRLVSGVNVDLDGWGVYDGRYAVDEARHSIAGGYKTALKLVKVVL